MIINKHKSLHSESTVSYRPNTSDKQSIPYKSSELFSAKFNDYLDGKVLSVDVIKYNNLLQVKKPILQYKIPHRKSTESHSQKRSEHNSIDFQEVKDFIVSRDEYNDDIVPQTHKPITESVCRKSIRFKNDINKPSNISQYQQDKRLNHLKMITDEYRKEISNNKCQRQESVYSNHSNRPVKTHSKQVTIIKQPAIQDYTNQLNSLKQDKSTKAGLISVYSKEFRAKSDYFMETHRNQQKNSKIIEELGDLDKYQFKFENTVNKFKQSHPRGIIKLNKPKSSLRMHKLNDDTSYDYEEDESMVSETEAKLNYLYSQSSRLKQKINRRHENPNVMINYMQKIDNIGAKIEKVNINKLTRFNVF